LPDGPINGWDFFTLAPPEVDLRPSQKQYALPSKSIRGMLRHIYAIATDSRTASPDISHLNPEDSLFGWVGQGPNQAIMGRLSFEFGLFDGPELAWFKVPYPYGEWRYNNGEWTRNEGGTVTRMLAGGHWRLFPHVPLAPIVEQLDEFKPEAVQNSYFKAILPGSRARFTIRFWNLTEEELQRLIWCIELEPDLAHKMGKHKHVGFGSLRFRLHPDSYLVDWQTRYAGKPEQEWRLPVEVTQWLKPEVIAHYSELKKALDAKPL